MKQMEHQFLRIIYVLIIVGLSLALIYPFLLAIVFAGTIALTLFPILQKLEERGMRRSLAAASLTAMFTFIISIPFGFFVIKGANALTYNLEKLALGERLKDEGMKNLVKTLRHDLVSYVRDIASKYEFLNFLTEARIEQYLVKVNAYLLIFLQNFISSLPTIFLLFLVMILCLYSFLVHAEGVKRFFQSCFGFDDTRMNKIVRIFKKDARQVYISNITTGSVQSIIVASGVALLGLADFFLVFFITLILSFIPVIGAAPVAFAFAIYGYFSGSTTAAIILVVLGAFTGVVDNFLRPWLATFGESKIPPISAFICVIGGALLLGFPGLFVGLLVGSFAYDTLPLFWKEIGRGDGPLAQQPQLIPNSSEEDPLKHQKH